MDDLIKELYAASHITTAPTPGWVETGHEIVSTFSLEKFAELLIERCHEQIDNLRGYSGYSANGEDLVSAVDWNFALDSAKAEISKLLEK
jgi:hypothetical protein